MTIADLEARADAAYDELHAARRRNGKGSPKTEPLREAYHRAVEALSDALVLADAPRGKQG